MKTSQTFKEMIPDLIKAQRELKPVLKKGHNPHFKSEYAEYQDVIEEVKKVLNKNNMWVTHATLSHSDNSISFLVMETLIYHTSGEWISTELPVINKAGTDQGLGSSITYTKRYSVEALMGVSTTKDDDGHAATKPHDPATAYFDSLPPDDDIAFEQLPDKPKKTSTSSLDRAFKVGKHTGKKFSEVKDPSYIHWVKDEVEHNLGKCGQDLKDFYNYLKSVGGI